MENGVANLANGLQREITSDVACLVQAGAFANRLPSSSRVFVLGKGSGFSPRVVWRLFLCLRRLRPDVLHTHNLGPLIYGAFATLMGRTCTILHGEHSRLRSDEKIPRRLRQRRRFYRACRAVHTVANGVREELIALGCNHPRIVSIANGVDTNRFSPGDQARSRAALGFPVTGRIVGIVGRFGRDKGHDVLLDAFDHIAPTTPELHLAIVGAGGPMESHTRTRASRSPYSTRIHFTGFLSDPVIAYRSLDLLVIPSINEGMANVALEAMASGVAILGNTDCGHEEFISNGATGAISNLRTSALLAHTLAELLEEPARLRVMGARARKAALDTLSLERMIAAYRSLYSSLRKSAH
jgi:glycosyltransferase involved in cell wall biosynthesis